MYVCLKISEAVDADSPFKIADGASANEVMRQRIEQGMHPGHPGRQEGAFFAYCTTNPSPEVLAALGCDAQNPSEVTDWLQAFMRWTAVHMENRNFQA